ncbi:MAG: DUF1674 domain-containing protein [Alphaproteobacteria bacterium]
MPVTADTHAPGPAVIPALPGTLGPRVGSWKTGPGETGPKESGGPDGLEPTRYGDWERRGRCIDF